MCLALIRVQKENVDYLLHLRLLRYRQTPNDHIRVKAHAIGVSIQAFTLGRLFDFGEFQETRI